MKSTSLLSLAVALPLTQAISVAYYEKTGCRGKILGHDTFSTDGATCWMSSASALGARSVQATDWDDGEYDSYGYGYNYSYNNDVEKVLRFYSSEDCSNSCTDRNVLGRSEWRDCVSIPSTPFAQGARMLSFDIVESGQTGTDRDGVLSDGACPALVHGDVLKINGHPFKMQQVAATLFRDVPLSEWDDAVHVRNTTNRFAQQGDVDAFGSRKFSIRHGWTEKIRLEYWNEKEHGSFDDDYAYDYEDYEYDWVEEVANDVERVCEAYDDREVKSESLKQFEHICAPKEMKKQLGAFKKASVKFTKFAGKTASQKFSKFVGDVQEVVGKAGL